MTGRDKMFGAIDWASVAIYLLLVVMGWMNIYAAVYDDTPGSLLDFRYGMQMLWICASLVLGVVILLIDSKYYHMLSYPLYWMSFLLLVAVIFFGVEKNGAKSWFVLGPVAIQPAEFMKFATALALARYMSNYSFSITRMKDLVRVWLLIMVPMVVIKLQNDTGSALVYASFLFMMYREGFNRWFYVVLLMAIALFILSFLLTPLVLLSMLILVCLLWFTHSSGQIRQSVIYIASLTLSAIVIYLLGNLLFTQVTAYVSLLVAVAGSLVFVLIYAYRANLRIIYSLAALFCASVLFTFTVDYVFNNFVQEHQQKRILDTLGLENDLKVWGYNVNQSKIAIGSGGFFGKGYLEGTQTKYNFVPEQSTDFIFCTIGEEWGFVGSIFVLAMFCIFILRLMKMGERQHEAFGRVYCYSVASVFLFHVAVNIGMTIGLMPVIGIPLPFFSYGGSSHIAFSLLFFVAVKLDSMKRETAIYGI